jgi:hypothetical protein
MENNKKKVCVVCKKIIDFNSKCSTCNPLQYLLKSLEDLRPGKQKSWERVQQQLHFGIIYNPEIQLVNDYMSDQFSIIYNRETNKAELTTTYSNQKVTDIWINEVTGLKDIVDEFNYNMSKGDY